MTGLPLGTTAEIISFEALERSYFEAVEQPHREHVTLYVKEHPDEFKIFSEAAPAELQGSEFRLTVDTPEDYLLMKEIYHRLHDDEQAVCLAKVINLLKTDPQLIDMNKIIIQKAVRDRLVLIRADGSMEMGMGHVARMINLAKGITAVKPVEVIFAAKNNEIAVETIRRAGFSVVTLPSDFTDEEELAFFEEFSLTRKPDAFIVDLLNRQEAYVKGLAKFGSRVICFDNPSLSKDVPDLLFNALANKDLKYMLFPPRIAELARIGSPVREEVRTILLSMGGSDPTGLTLRVLRVLQKSEISCKVNVVLGPAFPWKEEIREMLTDSASTLDVGINAREVQESAIEIQIVEDITDLTPLILEADLVFCSAGLTMFEVAALGTPAIVLSQHAEQLVNAEYLGAKGAVVNLGVGQQIADKVLLEETLRVVRDFNLRAELSAKAKETVDGQGTKRVVEKIVDILYEN